MSFVVKISDDYQNHTAQFIDPENLTWSKELVGVGENKFSLKIKDSQINKINEFKKIELFSVEGVVDESAWTGYIEDIQVNIQTIDLVCKDEKNFMRKRILYSDKNYSSKNVEYIVNEILTETNARAGDSFFSYDVGITDTLTKDWKKGVDYYQIFDDIALQTKSEWTVKYGKVIFKTKIGRDRTFGGNYFQLYYNQDVPNGNNITDFKIIRKGSSIKTGVIGKADAQYSEQTDTTFFPLVEGFKDFSGGDVATQTTEYLNKAKESQKQFELTIITADIDFREIEVGDELKLIIEVGNDLQDFNGSVRVLSKNSSVQNGVVDFNIRVSENPIRIFSPSNIIQDITQDIANIQKKI